MSNKLLKKIIQISTIVVVLLILGYYIIGELWGNTFRIRTNLYLHEEVFSKFAESFLGQNSINNIQTSSGIFKTTESINNCGRYPDSDNTQWICSEGEYPNIKSIRFQDINQVLEYENISKEEYYYYVNFMKKYKFNGLGKDNKQKLVELNDKLKGLHYYRQPDFNLFKENNKYTYIKKINGHWFYFIMDWN